MVDLSTVTYTFHQMVFPDRKHGGILGCNSVRRSEAAGQVPLCCKCFFGRVNAFQNLRLLTFDQLHLLKKIAVK